MVSLRTAVVLALGLAFPAGVALADPPPAARVKFEIRLAEKEAAAGLTEATVPGTDTKVYLHKEAVITNEDIAEAQAVKDKNSDNYAIEMSLTKEAGERMARVTGEHLDKPLAVLVDGKLIAAPTVRTKVGQRVLLTDKFTKEEAEKLVQGIKSK
jgi:preprotein translocase subunit SecD